MSAWQQPGQGDVPQLPRLQQQASGQQPVSDPFAGAQAWDPAWGQPPHAYVVAPDPSMPAPAHARLAPPAQPAPSPLPRASAPFPAAGQLVTAPALARDPGRSALAGVITFVVALVGLWAGLSYLHSMANALSTLNAGNAEMLVHLDEANTGLKELERKTGYLPRMKRDSDVLASQMGGINSQMGSMLTSVDTIGANMEGMNATIGTLDGELSSVNAANASITKKLGTISTGMASKQSKIDSMRRDVDASSRSLGALGPSLRATNARLAHINSVVCYMGEHGVTNSAKIHLSLGINLGTLDIASTVVPPGGWTC